VTLTDVFLSRVINIFVRGLATDIARAIELLHLFWVKFSRNLSSVWQP